VLAAKSGFNSPIRPSAQAAPHAQESAMHRIDVRLIVEAMFEGEKR
jgi:hypothetical protein